MNKFQEALDELLGNAVQQQSHVGVYENSEYANINGINKMIGYSQTLQKLVDRATPSKILGLSVDHEGLLGNCPKCKKLVFENEDKYYHRDKDCLQILDWRKPNE